MKRNCTNEYYQEVRKLLPEINFKEGRFLRDIKKALTDYEKAHPACTYEDLVKEFESPDDIVYNYILVEGKDYLFKMLDKKRYNKHVGVYAITTILILGISIMGIYFGIPMCAENNYSVIKETSITTETSFRKTTCITYLENGDYIQTAKGRN